MRPSWSFQTSIERGFPCEKNGFHAALAAVFMTMLVLPGIAGAENQPVPTAEQAAVQQDPALGCHPCKS
jgi:hypothetical protein